MKRTTLAAAAALLAIVSIASGSKYKVRGDTQFPREPLRRLTFLQAAKVNLDYYHREDGSTYTNIADKSAVFYAGTNMNAASYIIKTNSSVTTASGVFSFVLDPADINTNGVFAYTILVRDSDDAPFFSGTGTLDIVETTVTGNPNFSGTASTLNFSLFQYESVSNAGPYTAGDYMSVSNDPSSTTGQAMLSVLPLPFTFLSDSPSSYSGEGSKVLRVNAAEDAVEFATLSGIETDPIALAALIVSTNTLDATLRAIMSTDAERIASTNLLDTILRAVVVASTNDLDTTLRALISSQSNNLSAEIDGDIATHEAAGDPHSAAGYLQAETDPLAIHKDGSVTWTGNQDAGGYSITNLSPNSLSFSDGSGFGSIGTNPTFKTSNTGIYQRVAFRFEMLTDDATEASTRSAADTVHDTRLDAQERTTDDLERNVITLFAEADIDAHNMYDGWVAPTTNTDIHLSMSSNYTETIFADGAITWAFGNNNPNLYIHYPNDDNAASATVEDTSGNSNDGTASANTDTWSTNGIVGTALYMTATDEVDSGVSMASGAASWGMSLWFNNLDDASIQVLAIGGGWAVYAGDGVQVALNPQGWGASGEIALMFDGGWITSGGTNIADGTWHHIAGTYNGTMAKLYLDGAIIASNTHALNNAGTYPVGLGNTKDQVQGPNCAIDEFRYYTNVLTDANVVSLYNGGAPTADELPIEQVGGDMVIVTTNALWNTTPYQYTEVRMRVAIAETGDAITNDVHFFLDFALDGAGASPTWENVALEYEGPLDSTYSWYGGVTNTSTVGTNSVGRMRTEGLLGGKMKYISFSGN